MKKTAIAIFFALLAAWVFSLCKPSPTGSLSGTYLNLQDSVKYVGMATCRSCHDNVHQTFSQTGMGRSFHLATRQKSFAIFDKNALVYDTLNDFYYFPFFKNDTALYVLEFRLENGDTIHKRLEKIHYIVGSGQHTNSHIISQNGYIYQAPITWYTQEKRWDMAPGFRQNNTRFDRYLTDECITCHNHLPTMVPGSLNKFADMPTGIECERCHGPGEVHVREKLAGKLIDTARFIDYTIVNPRDLSRDRQMDLCQRCHLQGIAVAQPGKTFFDFRPGMALHEVMNVYLPRFTDSHERFIMASQADRLRMSECFKNSAEMTCITCHHPHHSVEATPKQQYTQACLKCHGENACPELKTHNPELKTEQDCAACHMPKSGSIDIPHVRITDHFIGVGSRQSAGLPDGSQVGSQGKEKAFLGIEILTKENPTPLDMARGYLALYDKYVEAPVMLDSAAFYLQKTTASSSEKFPEEVHLLFNRADYPSLVSLSGKGPEVASLDAWTAYRIGEAFYKLNDHEQALRYFSQAVARLPLHLDFLEKKGLALANLRRHEEAKAVFEKVLSENPKRPVALCNLGFTLVLSGQFAEGEKLYDRALALDPDYPQALINKAALLIYQNKKKEGKKLLERALKLDPGNEQAKMGLARLAG